MDSRLKRGRISSEVKSKVVLEALREVQTLSQIGSRVARLGRWDYPRKLKPY